MYVCMYVCMVRVSMYVCMSGCMSFCMYINAYIHPYLHKFPNIAAVFSSSEKAAVPTGAFKQRQMVGGKCVCERERESDERERERARAREKDFCVYLTDAHFLSLYLSPSLPLSRCLYQTDHPKASRPGLHFKPAVMLCSESIADTTKPSLWLNPPRD